MAQSQSDIKDDIEQLRADLRQLKDDLGTGARRGAADLRDTIDAKSREAYDYGQDLVRERPLTSVLTAAGIGALVGLLLSRSGRG